MSMPSIPDINPEINIVRDDAVNIIMASIAMEELALAHILNAEGEKLQYILGTLEGRDPGEVTICDIMAVNNSIHKTLRDVIKQEMLLQLKLEDIIELAENADECQLTIRGQKIWRDGNNVAATRPATVEINLLRDGEVFRTATVDSMDDGAYAFACVPVWRDSTNRYTYQVDEADVPGYTSVVSGYNITNTVLPGEITITGSKIWADFNNVGQIRLASITVNLLQNGGPTPFRTITVTSPVAPVNTVQFSFDNVPQFDDQGVPFVYTVDEADVAGYTKSIDNDYNITNTVQPILITIDGSKIWDDIGNETQRPVEGITVNLLQNGTQFREIVELEFPPAGEYVATFSFADVPLFDNQGVLYDYTVDEAIVPTNYTRTISDYDITNSFTP